MNRRWLLTGTVVSFLAFGCGDRPEIWDIEPVVVAEVGLAGSFALVDDAAHEVSLLTVGPDLQLKSVRREVGVNVVATQASADGSKLFVLTRGVHPRRTAEDQRPALWVYDGTGSGQLLAVYSVTSALGALAVDPLGQFVIVYSSGSSGGFVQNENELIIIDTTQPPSASNPVARTLRSFGGTPQRLTFTPALALPAGERRLLVVETDRDLALLDLNHLERPEITVKLSAEREVRPAGIAFTAGQPEVADDTRIAVRTTSESSVYLLTLGPQTNPQAPHDFAVQINIVGLSAVPHDIAFVQTDAGLRLAALQPSRRLATLVDPDTNVTSDVQMPQSYGRLKLITDQITNEPSGPDVALLWGGPESSGAGLAFWSLGKSVGQSYRSIEALPGLGEQFSEVLSVPAPHQELKILISAGSYAAGGHVYVLNLANRTAFPLRVQGHDLAYSVSADGQRAWFYDRGSTDLALVDLATVHPEVITVDRAISSVFDVQTHPQGGRALVTVHDQFAFGATVFNAFAPDPVTARSYAGLLQGVK